MRHGSLAARQFVYRTEHVECQKPALSPDADGWKDAMDQEKANLKLHDVYERVPHTNDMRTLKLGWVSHCKFKNGSFEKNKGRLIARDNHQRPGINYGESFSPVMRLESLHTILALAAILLGSVIEVSFLHRVL